VVFVTHSVSESVYLASRVIVMAPRPGRIARELHIAGAVPRPEGFRTSVAYAELCRDASLALAGALA
jgi:NitT/TauT family transport system ATP-binding protein